MAKIDEKKPGGKKSQYLGNHTYTTEAGHKFEFDNTPGDRRIHIYHASGTCIEIQDDGAFIYKAQKKTQEFHNDGKDEKITGNFNLVISGDVLVKVGGTYKIEANEIELVSHGEMRFKSGGKQLQEVGGDQRVQVNGKTSHRSSGDREEISGGNKVDTINGDLNQTIGGESSQVVSGDNAVLTGGEHQLVSAGGMGLGAGGQMGIASSGIMKLQTEEQFQTRAKTGTFIRDEDYVEVRSYGAAGGTLIMADGYKAGIFSKDNDVRIGAGGKLLVETDGGSKIDTAGLIAGAGKFYPS
jgi:hypothetical protein